MPTHSEDAPRPLPERPNLQHLKNQAKDLVKAGEADSLSSAQFEIARRYGFASWPKLKAHVPATTHLCSPLDLQDGMKGALQQPEGC